jgi:four helix bundle protein
MGSRSFEDLDVWKKACRLAVDICRVLKPSREFAFRDQMIRSVLSIPSNIAEGSDRDSDPEFRRFVSIAKASAAELRTQLYIAVELEIVSRDKALDFIQQTKELSRMLQGLRDAIK